MVSCLRSYYGTFRLKIRSLQSAKLTVKSFVKVESSKFFGRKRFKKILADESLHQNVIHTLPACFKRSHNLNNNNNLSPHGIQKRIITVVSPDGQKYRDPNLRQSPTGFNDGNSKPLKRLNSNQIRLVRLVLKYCLKLTRKSLLKDCIRRTVF